MNEVINRIDAGHVASFKGDRFLDPDKCKACHVPWPCPTIQWARQQVRLMHGVKKVA
jgi:hypothetical protein